MSNQQMNSTSTLSSETPMPMDDGGGDDASASLMVATEECTNCSLELREASKNLAADRSAGISSTNQLIDALDPQYGADSKHQVFAKYEKASAILSIQADDDETMNVDE